MDKFQNKYRIQSTRLRGWDYANEGVYFLTLCVQDKQHLFGKIKEGKMILNEFGKIAYQEWENSAQIRQEIELDEFIIMPNHMHGIVIIRESAAPHTVQTHGRVSQQYSDEQTENSQEQTGNFQQFEPDLLKQKKLYRSPKSISSFIAGYKAAVTTKINRWIDTELISFQKYNRKNRLWQPNYYDHIIRNPNAYQNIKHYIINNPMKWEIKKIELGICRGDHAK